MRSYGLMRNTTYSTLPVYVIVKRAHVADVLGDWKKCFKHQQFCSFARLKLMYFDIFCQRSNAKRTRENGKKKKYLPLEKNSRHKHMNITPRTYAARCWSSQRIQCLRFLHNRASHHRRPHQNYFEGVLTHGGWRTTISQGTRGIHLFPWSLFGLAASTPMLSLVGG